MKRIVVVFICLLVVKNAFAQKDVLSLNEQNKYIYYQVVDQQGLPKDTLQDRALFFLQTEYPNNKIKQGEASGNFTGRGRFIVFSGITLVKHEDGEISYTFYIECKDQKYRYWLTDFVYTPHKTDRYGNSVPDEGINIPLESGTAKLDKRELDICLNQTGAYAKTFGEKLKKYMVKTSALSAKGIKKTVVITKDW